MEPYKLIQRETTTDQLIKIIRVVQLGRKTGLLTAERGEKNTYEEGLLFFSRGQIVEAQSGQSRGQDAINKLNNWGTCRFAFIPMTGEEVANHTSRRFPDTAPMSSVSLMDTPKHKQRQTSQALPSVLSFPPPQESKKSHSTSHVDKFPKSSSPSTSSFFIVPRRVHSVNEALYLLEAKGFSRAHKQLLLLIDGRRTTSDLVRLTKRTTQEVFKLLIDLQDIGSIHM